eukprot:TRINITY_DN3238_c0_g1_i2.p1 TRINITY_DN3238_c0_g1~~TRINITY_DN3238_c0_g1_i2.p1  ORF type:complete len:165 (+),score=30.61 TRINITY_DN3238_c0_g1_i2:230-724(+)
MWNVDQLSLVTLSTVVTLFLSLVTFVTLLLSLVTFVTLLLSLVTFVTSHHVKLPNQKMIGRILVFITVASLILHASYETIQLRQAEDDNELEVIPVRIYIEMFVALTLAIVGLTFGTKQLLPIKNFNPRNNTTMDSFLHQDDFATFNHRGKHTHSQLRKSINSQ